MTLSRNNFPPDDNGDVLFSLARKGIDLSFKRKIEFSCIAKNSKVAELIVTDLVSYGYESEIYVDDGEDGTGKISIYAGIVMLPEHQLLLIEQDRLDAILKHHGTKCDGWMTES